jgi:hypothetical protein
VDRVSVLGARPQQVSSAVVDLDAAVGLALDEMAIR